MHPKSFVLNFLGAYHSTPFHLIFIYYKGCSSPEPDDLESMIGRPL